MNFYFNGVWRMDWGFGNPNKTAALIAILMICVWVFLLIRKLGFWIAICLYTILGVCLAETVSRGGLIAAISGLALLACVAERPWRKRRLLALLLSTSCVIGYSVCFKTYSRYERGIEDTDPSIANRLTLWSKAPAMMFDSPDGWGLGNAGRAYMQWFQPTQRHEVYRTLVNSHLTWLVEVGWPLRFFYIFGWICILVLMWPAELNVVMMIPFAVWVSFFLSSFFSSVAESLWLWVVPALSLLSIMIWRYNRNRWPSLPVWWRILGASVFLVAALFGWGALTSKLDIQGSEGEVTIGSEKPAIWIVTDVQTLGPDYGRTLRRIYLPRSIGLVTSGRIPKSLTGDTIMICGSPSAENLNVLRGLAKNFGEIIALNPSFLPQDLGLDAKTNVFGYFGEFAKTTTSDEWRNLFNERVVVLEGTGDFVPKWPILLKPKD